jgi:enamine deaminase RidA (YjgF/YER057c/UK114 family)
VSIQTIDPESAPTAAGGYTQACGSPISASSCSSAVRFPETPSGHIPDDFDSQCRQAWTNVISVLTAAGLTTNNLVKVTTYLSDRRHAETKSRVRREMLGNHRPALTVVITGIYHERWLLEIEAMAGV